MESRLRNLKQVKKVLAKKTKEFKQWKADTPDDKEGGQKIYSIIQEMKAGEKGITNSLYSCAEKIKEQKS